LEVAAKELENRQAVLTATLDEEWLDPFMKTASRRLASRVEIPGFRKGKAPHRVVVRHMGREALVREVIDDLGQAAYEEALKESGLEPIQLDDLEIAEWEPLALRMTVSLPPVVELGDYRSVPLTMEVVEIADEDVEQALKELQEQYAERVPVDRVAQLSDFAVLDVYGTLDDRVALKSEGQEYELRENGDAIVAGFGQSLAGMSPGEDRSFSLTYPEDYEDEDLAGREVSFRVHLHELQEKRHPAVDDELAKMVGGFGTVGELREYIRQDLHARREAKQQDDLAEGLLDTLLQQAEIDSPPTFVNRELDSMLRGLAYDLQQQGFTLDGYLRTTNRTVEDLIEEFRPTAEKRVGKSLILAELVKEEGVEVADSDIEQEVARMTRVYGQEKEALREALLGNEQVREEIRNRLYGRKVVQRLAGQPEATEEGQEGSPGPVVADGEESSSDKETSPEAAESV
jgi:trigger factor